MRFLVLVREHGQDWTSEGCSLLRRHGEMDLVNLATGQEEHVLARLLELLPEADAVVMSPWYRPPTTPEHWSAATRLKVLAGTFDNRFTGWVDFEALSRRGIALVDTSRSMTPSVAEFALAMTLNLIRDIPASIDLVRTGTWKPASWDKPGFVFGDLTGRRVGLAGFGSINRRYAELLAPFRCSVRACDPYVSDEALARYGVERAPDLADLARCSEILVIGIPPTPRTQGIIDRSVIDALPVGALLVLVTRMAVVEQEALWRRVERGEIRAAIDVFAPEPPPAEAWFRQHANVLPTPHVAGATVYCNRRCFTDACQDAVAVLTGGQPRFVATLRDHQCYQGLL